MVQNGVKSVPQYMRNSCLLVLVLRFSYHLDFGVTVLSFRAILVLLLIPSITLSTLCIYTTSWAGRYCRMIWCSFPMEIYERTFEKFGIEDLSAVAATLTRTANFGRRCQTSNPGSCRALRPLPRGPRSRRNPMCKASLRNTRFCRLATQGKYRQVFFQSHCSRACHRTRLPQRTHGNE